MSDEETPDAAWRAGFFTAIELGKAMEESDAMICIPRQPLRELYAVAERIAEKGGLVHPPENELWHAVATLFLAVPDLGGEE